MRSTSAIRSVALYPLIVISAVETVLVSIKTRSVISFLSALTSQTRLAALITVTLSPGKFKYSLASFDFGYLVNNCLETL